MGGRRRAFLLLWGLGRLPSQSPDQVPRSPGAVCGCVQLLCPECSKEGLCFQDEEGRGHLPLLGEPPSQMASLQCLCQGRGDGWGLLASVGFAVTEMCGEGGL